jgi:predicted XRE-type DNA-binding protein
MNKSPPGKKSARRREGDDKVHNGSGNVFADLGLPNAEEHLAKADLAHWIIKLIKSAQLSQREAAERLGVDQPKISALIRGRLQDFSIERLMRFVTALDQDVVITIRNPQDVRHPSLRVLVKA